MVDLVKLTIHAGNGGDGRISFLRNRRTMKGGPDGGDGGNGGSVIAKATSHENTLRNYSGISILEADNGHMGGAEKMHGSNSENLVVLLPVGTRIWRILDTYQPNQPKRMYRNDRDLGRVERSIERRAGSQIEENEGVFTLADEALPATEKIIEAKHLKFHIQEYDVQLVGDLTENGEELLIARGGRGGRGNEQFKSSRNTTPMEAQTGEGGESGEYIFELQLLADVGLVGFPNAGKSTLLSVLTKATPKIADYPFTTLEPNLGVMTLDAPDSADRRTLVIADIPGIIEGASEGKGLGHEFLRHVSRCKILLFLLAGDEYLEEYKTLESELVTYAKDHGGTEILENKQRIIVLSKADLHQSDEKETIRKQLLKKKLDIFWISSATGEGLDELRNRFRMIK